MSDSRLDITSLVVHGPERFRRQLAHLDHADGAISDPGEHS